MSNYVTVAQSAANVRRALKEKLKLGSKQVSVRAESFAGGSAVRVRIKAAVALHKVEEIAKEEQRISRCEITGDILSGGNRYVSVDFDYDFTKEYGKQFEGELPIKGFTVPVTKWVRCTKTDKGFWVFEATDSRGEWVRTAETGEIERACTCWAEAVLRELDFS